ncbi:Protein argonaute MEL1 [Ananas comosus]|uniref:Protein argonaute MEL1 n=1 Tax=Ananas comosus TaxID=4615 RepID=A0A199VPJ4_ANACO|nr:Protein argonaute MEL1 [Ananas comosus]
MSQRGGGGGGGGGGGRRGRGRGRGRGGGEYNYPREPPTGAEAPYAQRGGGRGGGRGRGGDGEGAGPQPPPHGAYQARRPHAAADAPSSSSSSSAAAAAEALGEEVRRLTIREEAPGAPAAAAAKQEEAAAAVPVARPPASSRAVKYTPRPGFGTVGTRCVVRANHFLVQVADADLCHYDVSVSSSLLSLLRSPTSRVFYMVAISPESKSIAINRAIISELVRLHRPSLLGGRIPAYDGKKSLYTAGALPFDVKDFAIKLPGEREKEYKVTIRFAGRADLHHLQQFLDGQQRDMPQETIQVLDVVLRETPSTKYVTALRSFFSPTFGQRSDIGEGLECWRGYYQSVRPTQMGLSLNIDICATSFYRAIPIVDFVGENLKLSYNARPLSDRDVVKIKKALRGIRVEATHRRDKCIRYRISGVTSVPMNQLMYFPFSCNPFSFSLLCVFCNSFAMMVCKIVEGQRYAKKLNERQVANILRATCQRPQQREQSILEV